MVGFAYGVAVDADLALGLPSADRPAEVTVRAMEAPADDDAVRWFPDEDDSPWTGGQLGADYVLRFDDKADFSISDDGSTMGWYAPETPTTTLVHLVLDHALPYCLMRRGHLVLHASCLVAPRGLGYAIAGPSGYGKSTLAATMLARGHRFLADDCAAVDLDDGSPLVAPAYPGLRLDRRSTELVDVRKLREAGPVSDLGHKRRLATTSASPWAGDERFPLRTVFVLGAAPLEPGEGAEVPRRLTGSAALLALLPNSFHIAAGDDRALVLERLARLAESCRIEEILYHHSAVGLQLAIERIEQVLDALPAVHP